MTSQQKVGNQNWDIATDGSQRILVANNYGLLVIDGEATRLHNLPEETMFRSVEYINARIYTGSFEDFGFWEESESGELLYHSLASRLENPEMNNDEVWKIVEYEGVIYFHSFGSVYAYNGEDVYRLNTPGSFMLPHLAGGRVYSQLIQGGLYRLVDDEFELVPGSDFLEDEEVKSIIDLKGNKILIGTSNGMYTYDGQTFEDWDAERTEEVIQNQINKMVRTEDKIVVGTILNGLYIFDLNFNLIKNINTQSHLQNNTILSLEVDSVDNLWVGMDRGLDYIDFNTPVNVYSYEMDDIGSVYSAELFNDELYIGTNQGIYWLKSNENGSFYDISLIPDSQGQVWFIKEIEGVLYAGLNDGTFVIENKTLRKVGYENGGYNLKRYPGESRNILLQSTYNNLVVYQKNDSVWEQSNIMTGFQAPARFLEFDHLGNIWLGHAVRGIFQLQPNIQFDNISNVKNVSLADGLPLNNNRVFKLGNRIMTSVADTLYEWDAIHEQFVHFNGLDQFFTESGVVKNIIPAGMQRFWVIKDSEILLLEVHFNSIKLLYRVLPDMYNFNLVEGYENVVQLTENLHLFCLDDGFAILDMEQTRHSKFPIPRVRIQSVSAVDYQENQTVFNTEEENEIELSNQNNTVTFNWSTSQLAGIPAFFQYKLDNLDAGWSSWSEDQQAEYLRLPSGVYTFSVRAIDLNGSLTETTSVTVTIQKPWYQSPFAYFLYFLMFASLGITLRLYYSRKRWKEHGRFVSERHTEMARDREKANKEIIKLKNEKLQSEVDHKSSQLASNTMAIMRKNNLLSTIKDELQLQKDNLGESFPDKSYTKLMKLIEDGVEDEHEWEIFEQLYNEAHGNFFRRLKETYPQLTPSDLRLCAYLRMNLSSKEIAPLLNISVRGVEERRYRLRKRLEISTETNLTELIMTF
ncbi:triple tyrosine motif-containing protein [Rhodohalobacter sp.]|uniref:helix-turn-helix and ligand-binding sensor domain-containing protein n=1 Tax=Rhodohalobacter sp. TaxID=1974210 RepID=UPI002ACD316D|nr:triple tyrosine motif-containing protein [Rhodohalobacter sp.]MDZ7757302.1 triple tyrosine motif-containing protein [Rhodohalobacter sp.]